FIYNIGPPTYFDFTPVVLSVSGAGFMLGILRYKLPDIIPISGDSEACFKSFSENAPVIIFSLDENGALKYANPAWQTLLGHSCGEVLGRPLADFIAKDQNQPIDRTFDQLIKGQLPTAEFNLHMVHRDGSQHIFNTSASANSDAEGRFTGIVGLAKDVTEEKRLQQQLFQSQKMEAVGTLAGGIAHDFNNLLMGMQANLSLLRLELGHCTSFDEKFKRIEDQIHSGASLTHQLLGYARKGKYAVTVFDLNKLVEGTLNVVRRTNKNIIIRLRLDEASTFIRADQGQIELVLLNLFLNAVDAMPHGGKLMVSTALKIQSLPDNPAAHLKSGHCVEVTVEDTGTGMDKSTLDQIFEPFFTTKEVGRGTGLGLASVYGVIQNHCGHIDVRSEPNIGSTFTVRFPAAAAPENRRLSDKNPARLPSGDVKILLVDDEPLILKYSHEMIASLGISVISTTDPEEAVSLYRDQWDCLDLVVLDMVMPKMDGMQLFVALYEINPNVRAIVTSGYSMDSRISELMDCGHHDFLKKPYTLDDLAKSISGLIGTHPRLPRAKNIKAV
ncbi:MAG: PAS domain S-box protein, partial [Desulfobacteraceae bacterium]